MIALASRTNFLVLGRIIHERLDDAALLPRVWVRDRDLSQIIIAATLHMKKYSTGSDPSFHMAGALPSSLDAASLAHAEIPLDDCQRAGLSVFSIM